MDRLCPEHAAVCRHCALGRLVVPLRPDVKGMFSSHSSHRYRHRGWIGLVTGASLSEMGNHVLCLDVDEQDRDPQQRRHPDHEPGLEQMVKRNAPDGRLEFTTDVVAAVHHGTLQLIGVGTPPDEDGSADLQYVLAAARSIGQHMTDYKVIVDKSTVPVGTADRVRAAVQEVLAERGVSGDFAVVSKP